MSQDKKYTGRFIGEVVSVDDPDKQCRVKVNAYDIFDGVPTKDLPWSMTSLPLGARAGEGLLTPMQKGDKVWIEFIGGDSRRPVVVGSALASPNGKTDMPDDLCGRTSYAHKRTDREPAVPDTPYYQDTILRQNGALIQICRNGNIRVTQTDSGSALEIAKDGSVVIHCEKDIFISSKGNTLHTVDGNYTLEVKGNMTTQVQGTMAMSSTQSASYGSSTSSLNLNAATQGTMTGGGGLALNGPTTMRDNLTCQANVSASGDIIAGGANSNHHSH